MSSKVIRCTLLMLMLATVSQVSAQTEWSMASTRGDSAKHAIGTFGEGHFNSNVLDNRFVFSFLGNRDFIETETKQRIEDRLGANNRAGGDLNLGIYYSQRLKSVLGRNPYDFSWFVRVADRQHIHTEFAGDVFKLGFFGNKRFAGDTAHLGNFTLNTLRYQQLQLGFLNDNGCGFTWGAGFSFLTGEEQRSIDVSRLDFYTSPIGDSLSVDTRATVLQSDSGNTGLGAFNGVGASVDLMMQFEVNLLEPNRHGRGFFRAEVNDLGYLWWNDQSLNYDIDSVYEYTGIVIDDLFELNDSVLQASIPDTIIDNTLDQQTRGSYRTTVPATVRLTLAQEHHKGWMTQIRFEQRLAAGYQPWAMIKESYRVNPWLQVSLKAAYGGYGRFFAGAEAWLSNGTFDLVLGSNSLEGVFLPRNSAGNNAYLSLRTQF